MQNIPIQQCQQYNPYMTPTDYSGVHIQIINPSVGTPGAAPVYNVNAPQYQTPTYPQNYYTNNLASNSNGQQNPNGMTQSGGFPNLTQTINGVNPINTNPSAANPYNNGFAEGYNAGYLGAVNAQKAAHCSCCNCMNNGMSGANNANNSNNTNNTTTTTSVVTETKKTEKRNIIELTDPYIKNLENYLNSQDKEVRLMGAKEVVARLQEDDSRRDDRALTALVNKMLQDPYQPVRFLALAMLDTRACTGDDYTVAVLQEMQQGKSGYGQDALQASQILLKMSGQTVQKEFEVKEQPNKKEEVK